MRAKIRTELKKIKPGATQCPGKLSRDVGRTLRELRPTLEKMARAGEIEFYQKGRHVKPGEFRGPFRVVGPR
jgi:predicted transcriptional regulator